MPQAPSRACSKPSCRGVVCAGVCSVCGPRKYVDRRKSARHRGYSTAWDKLRDAYIAKHPLCQVCSMEGRTRMADLVHHLERVAEGNAVLVDYDHLLAVCKSCHPTVEGNTALGWQAKHYPPTPPRR